MSDHFSWGLQKAIFSRLAENADLTALLNNPPRIFDAPPSDAVFPYLILGETRVRDWAGVDGGLEHEIRINAYSKYQGRREVKDLLNTIYDTLHEAEFSIEGRRLVHIRFVFADIFPRADGGVFQGVARFRAVTMKDVS